MSKTPSQVDIAAHAAALTDHTAALKANTRALKAHTAALASVIAARAPKPGDIYSQGPCESGSRTVWRYDDHLQPTIKSQEPC